MLPTDVLNTLRALSLNERPPITALPDKDTSGKGAFELGQKVQGTIQSQVGAGVFKVRVLEQMMHMQLPENLKSGDVVELQVLSLQPRLTFSLVTLSNPYSAPETLSNTSLLLSALSQKSIDKSNIATAQTAPLITETTTPDISALAVKLHDSLSKSGLFYEAHQAQWLSGARSTAQLLQEPQNQLALAATGEDSNNVTSSTTAQQNSTLSNIPGQLQNLVQQQLNALETRQVFWQGPAWQNQMMEWEIHEEQSRQNQPGFEDAGKQWATQIRLDLPNLGEVAAMLRFNNNGLSITLDASGNSTRAVLGAASSQLTAALTERGIKVSSTLVSPHGE